MGGQNVEKYFYILFHYHSSLWLIINYDSNDDCKTYEEYLKFTKEWLTNCYNWSKNSARLLLNIPLDKNKFGHQSVGADITLIAKKIGI